MPLVSICIPTYNGGTHLAECLDSALAQSFRDIDILLVDDASTDDTVPIARSYARRDQRIRIAENERNLGLVGNWNQTVRLAQSEWIKFLHQDDRLEPDCVARMLDAATPGVDLVATQRHVVFAPDTPDDIKRLYLRHLSDHNLASYFPGQTYISPMEFAEILLRVPDGNCIGEPTATMVRRTAFAHHGYFNPELTMLCDWEYWARLGVNTGLCYVDVPLATFRVHSRGTSAQLRSTKRFRAFRLEPLLVLYEMTYSPSYAALRAIARSRTPPVNLRQRLSDAVCGTRWEASAEEDGGKAMAEWWAAIRRHPRLLAFPPAYILRFLLEKGGLLSRRA
jgi:glycosyltransferase involved in cell wall biosynthesis